MDQRKHVLPENRIMGIVFAVLAAVLFGVSFRYSEDSALYVRFILTIMFVLSCILFFKENKISKTVIEIFTQKRLTALVMIILYVIALPLLGFFVSSFIFSVLFMYFNLKQDIPKYVIVSLCGTIILFLVFKVWLGVWFPTGILI